MNNKRVRRDDCGASTAIATRLPSSFASCWKPTAVVGMEGITSDEPLVPPPANAGGTVAIRPQLNENLPGKFRIVLFRDDEVVRNPGRNPSDLVPCGSSGACRSFELQQRDLFRDLLLFAHEHPRSCER